jgi:hypothetical protein
MSKSALCKFKLPFRPPKADPSIKNLTPTRGNAKVSPWRVASNRLDVGKNASIKAKEKVQIVCVQELNDMHGVTHFKGVRSDVPSNVVVNRRSGFVGYIKE